MLGIRCECHESSEMTLKTNVQCHSRCDTLKNSHCSMAVSAEHTPIYIPIFLVNSFSHADHMSDMTTILIHFVMYGLFWCFSPHGNYFHMVGRQTYSCWVFPFNMANGDYICFWTWLYPKHSLAKSNWCLLFLNIRTNEIKVYGSLALCSWFTCIENRHKQRFCETWLQTSENHNGINSVGEFNSYWVS